MSNQSVAQQQADQIIAKEKIGRKFRLDEIKKTIFDGDYNVSIENVVDKILKDHKPN